MMSTLAYELERLGRRLALEGRWNDALLVCEALYYTNPDHRHLELVRYCYGHGVVLSGAEEIEDFENFNSRVRKQYLDRRKDRRNLEVTLAVVQKLSEHINRQKAGQKDVCES